MARQPGLRIRLLLHLVLPSRSAI